MTTTIEPEVKARAKTIKEAVLQAAVIKVAHLLGYRVAHFRPARTAHGYRTAVGADGKGWPDLFLVRPGRVVAIELKSQSGQLTAEQRAWRQALEAAGIEWHLWRPSHWLAGEIEAALA